MLQSRSGDVEYKGGFSYARGSTSFQSFDSFLDTVFYIYYTKLK